jgi:hypothetical protein
MILYIARSKVMKKNLISKKVSKPKITAGQSAIEYLMTYGWMLMVVGVVGGSMYSIAGNQNIETVSGFNSQDLDVQDFSTSLEKGLRFSIEDPTGRTHINEITVFESNTSITYILNQEVSGSITANLPGIIPSEDSNEIKVKIKYDSGELQNIETRGEVYGALKANDNLDNRTILVDGLIGYWPLSETYSQGDITYDLSNNDFHGSVSRTIFENDPYLGSSAEFNGSDNNLISVENNDQFRQKDDLSVGAWFRPEESQPRGHAVAIHQGKYSDLYGYAITINENGYATFAVGEGENFGGVGVTAEAPVNEPTHIMGVYDNNRIRIFQNGSLVESKEINFNPEYEGDNFMLGRRADWWTRFYSGKMKDVVVYDRALTQNEIRKVYR